MGIEHTLAGCTADRKAGAAEIAGVGSTVVASTGVGSAVVPVTAIGGVEYGKLVMGVLSGATEMQQHKYINNKLPQLAMSCFTQ